MRTLVAGFGNVLRGDDGVGVEVVRRLEAAGWGAVNGVRLVEIGTGGVQLAQELLDPFDRLVIVDAMARGGPPGRVYAVRVDHVPPADIVDPHTAVPARALAMAAALRALPSEVFIVGCEPGDVDELTLELSPPVRRAADEIVTRVIALLQESPR